MRFGLDLHESITANMRSGRRRFFGTTKRTCANILRTVPNGTSIGMSQNACIGMHQEPRKGTLSVSVFALEGAKVA